MNNGVKRKNIVFLTGTRADFGKLHPLIDEVENSKDFECQVFVTGMHMISRYGYTVREVRRLGYRNIHAYMNQIPGEPMDLVLANTIHGLSRYIHEVNPDLLIIHGDRIEALAGAIVGSLRSLLTVHIEGGELSGTIDDLIRHSVSKMSHAHFVANSDAAKRLRQLGEAPESIFEIGSPDIDTMLGGTLPSLEEVRSHYEIQFPSFAIGIFHPVTTELERLERDVNEFVTALIDSQKNYVMIYPNSDEGSAVIFKAYERLQNHPRFRFYPSLRFQYFLTALKHSEFIIGNSSSGIREAPVYSIPSIDIGSRQTGRFNHGTILHVDANRDAILGAIAKAPSVRGHGPSLHFGKGDSVARFMKVLRDDVLWSLPKQKKFQDLPNG